MKNKLIIFIFTSQFLISCGGNYSGNEEAIIRSATSYRFVSGGNNGKIHYSYDAINFETTSTSQPQNIEGIAYGIKKFIAIDGGGNVFSSINGSSWNKILKENDGLNDIIYKNDSFFIIGNSGIIMSSKNGLNWSKATSLDNTLIFKGITYGFGSYFAVSTNKLFSSSDGINWSQKIIGVSGNFNNIYANTEIIVIVGNSGFIATSFDGSTFTTRTSGTIKNLNKIIFSKGVFVVIGDTGIILSSSDGLNYDTTVNGDSDTLNDIIYVKNKFIAVGNSGKIMFSYDGLKWDKNKSGDENYFNISYGEIPY